MSAPRSPLEARVSSLETTLRRLRILAGVLALALLTLAAAAWRPASTEVQATSLVLTDATGHPLLTLAAEPSRQGPGLILADPSGRVVMRLGGQALRPVR